MSSDAVEAPLGHDDPVTVAAKVRRWRIEPMYVLVAGIVAIALTGRTLHDVVASNPTLATAGTIFAGVFVQALPFLALGVIVSGLVAVYMSPERLARWLPRRPSAAIVTAGAAGAAFPGCECGSVPVARRLYGDGRTGAAALTFMLTAPAINPVVIVSTVVAFPGQPEMAVGTLCRLTGHGRHRRNDLVAVGARGVGHQAIAQAARSWQFAVGGLY